MGSSSSQAQVKGQDWGVVGAGVVGAGLLEDAVEDAVTESL